jgi:hypothetical protein
MDLERRIAAVEARNKRVEAEKAWEVSATRRLSIAATTYVAACIFLSIIGTPNTVLAALVPTGGYLLSTLSLPWIKKRWMQNRFMTDAEMRQQ